MIFADEQLAAQTSLDTLGARADAAISDLTRQRDAATADLAAARTAFEQAKADDVADATLIVDLRAQIATAQQRVSDVGILLAQAQAAQAKAETERDAAKAAAAHGSASDALVAALRLEVARLTTPLPTGPNGVEPVVAGAKSVRDLAGATLSAKNNALTKGQTLTLPVGIYSDNDFRRPAIYPVYAHFLHNVGALLGSGRGTVITVGANTLDFTNTTDAERKSRPRIESIAEPGTDPYYLARFDVCSLVQDVTFLGTAQSTDPSTGKEYSFNGVQFYGTTDPTLRRVVVRHIPGSKGVPPNETFPVYFYKVKGKITLEDVLIDGDGVSSSGVSGQPAEGVDLAVLLNRVRCVGGPNGAGWTCFNRAFKSIRLIDHATDGSLVGANFENVVVNGGNADGKMAAGDGVRIVRPDYRNPSGYRAGEPTWRQAYHHVSIDASLAGGTNGKSVPGVSNRVDIYDPVLDVGGKVKVCISDGYGYENVPKGGQAQRGSDVHVWTGGAWSADPATDGARYLGGTERPDLLTFTRSQGAGLAS